MSGGWVPMPADVWPIVAERLSGPWPDEAAAFDLRWHIDQRGDLPSRRELARRWSWTEGQARTLLRHPERWWDPMKGPLPASRGDLSPSRPALTQRRPALTQPDPTTTSAERYKLEYQEGLTQPDPTTTSADPESTTRAEITLTLTPTLTGGGARAREDDPAPLPAGGRARQQPDPHEWAAGLSDAPPREAAADVCAVLSAVRGCEVRPAEAMRSVGLVRAALAATADSLPELLGQVELVAAWGLGSPDGQDELGGIRARSGERWGADRSRLPSWVLGPRWPDWLAMARSWDSRGRMVTGTGAPVRGDHPGRYAVASAEDLEAMEQLRRELETTQRIGEAK